jgi:CheY-like chemotaxis protein
MTRSRHARKVSLMRPDPIPDVPVTSPRRRELDPATRPGTPTVGGSQLVALVVDDEPMVGELMAMALGSQGWRTVVATAAEEAAALARDQAINLLVTDLQMPGMSGLDLARRLRERHADLPVVLMSGWRGATALELAQPFVFLYKPFRLQRLFEAIGSLLADHPNTVPAPGAPQGVGPVALT